MHPILTHSPLAAIAAQNKGTGEATAEEAMPEGSLLTDPTVSDLATQPEDSFGSIFALALPRSAEKTPDHARFSPPPLPDGEAADGTASASLEAQTNEPVQIEPGVRRDRPLAEPIDQPLRTSAALPSVSLKQGNPDTTSQTHASAGPQVATPQDLSGAISHHGSKAEHIPVQARSNAPPETPTLLRNKVQTAIAPVAQQTTPDSKATAEKLTAPTNIGSMPNPETRSSLRPGHQNETVIAAKASLPIQPSLVDQTASKLLTPKFTPKTTPSHAALVVQAGSSNMSATGVPVEGKQAAAPSPFPPSIKRTPDTHVPAAPTAQLISTSKISPTKSANVIAPLLPMVGLLSNDIKSGTASSLDVEQQFLPRTDGLAPQSTTQAHIMPARLDLPHQVSRQIAEALQQMPNRPVEISLSPEELGRVRLTVSSSEAGIVVNVLAERAETIDLMRRHINTLEAAFQEIGYSDISFSFSGEAQTGDGSEDHTSDASDFTANDQGLNTAATSQIDLSQPVQAGLDIRL